MITNTKVIITPCTECSWDSESYVLTYLVRFAIAIGVAKIAMGFNRSSFAFSDDCKRAVAFLYLSLPHTVPTVSAYILTPYVFVFPTGLILLSALSYTFAAVDEQMYSYKKNNKLTLLVFVPFSLSVLLP